MIRQAMPTDFQAMSVIGFEASRVGHHFPGEGVLREQLVTVTNVYFPQANNWAFEKGGSICGFIGLLSNHVGGLFVNPDAHLSGIGRTLIEYAVARVGPLTVDVYEQNQGAVAFYKRCDFTENGRKELDDEGRSFPLSQMARAA